MSARSALTRAARISKPSMLSQTQLPCVKLSAITFAALSQTLLSMVYQDNLPVRPPFTTTCNLASRFMTRTGFLLQAYFQCQHPSPSPTTLNTSAQCARRVPTATKFVWLHLQIYSISVISSMTLVVLNPMERSSQGKGLSLSVWTFTPSTRRKKWRDCRPSCIKASKHPMTSTPSAGCRAECQSFC